MYGKVVFMEFTRVNGSRKEDTLFIATEVEKLCMFQWDANASNVISIHTMLFDLTVTTMISTTRLNSYTDFCQGGTISSKGETVVLYSRRKWLRVVQIDDKGHGTSKFKKNFPSTKILDVKFLTDDIERRLALLFKGNDGNFHSGIYEILIEDIVPLVVFQPYSTIEPKCLIPSLTSFLLIGKKHVVYVDANEIISKCTGYFDIQAYGRVDETPQRCRYLLGGHDGHLVVIMLHMILEASPTLPFLTPHLY